ncbi:hypothetical protein K402DRAFT_456196 [Aulographum hederae CBS 113979]|uniref:Orc1-like AAA ATPase domain-containing protein n=1 Tax=Aulographum hederae CBS 113979 TaxID=1176131 RepID=A0A6G1GSL3_9PEZI|nr:hypothetical protein K402DRAFT_456196 [Aulographum hederae CBS 113979]
MRQYAPLRIPRSIGVQRRIAIRTRPHPIWSRALYNGPPLPNTDPNPVSQDEDGEGGGPKKSKTDWKGTAFKMFESAMTTLASISVLGLIGYSYTRYYKHLVLEKMENAFKPGDPVLELAELSKSMKPPTNLQRGEKTDAEVDHWVIRDEQPDIDDIVSGKEGGHYHLLIGEKGTGKSSMLIDAMHKIDGEGCAMFEAHADLEIFRVRLGKALDFEYHEDNIGSLFSIRGPRDASALLDIERAFNKLEKVALKRRKLVGRPLILIVNSVHLLRDDDDGRDLLELIQQRAEQWAASNLCTVILNSDDYWVYERLKNLATRMRVTPVGDLPKHIAINALKNYRRKYFQQEATERDLEEVYDMVGGRLTFLNRVAKAEDMRQSCETINEVERTWFLNKCWILGEEMDDDVMDQQKYASAAMVMAKALVDRENNMDKTYDDKRGHILPSVPLHEARQIMTRADFIQSYDHINIFAIDSNAMVRADSVPMQNAFRTVCAQPGFAAHLEATLERISAIESLGRTRELTIKDLWNGGSYAVVQKDRKGLVVGEVCFEARPREDKDGEGEDGGKD